MEDDLCVFCVACLDASCVGNWTLVIGLLETRNKSSWIFAELVLAGSEVCAWIYKVRDIKTEMQLFFNSAGIFIEVKFVFIGDSCIFAILNIYGA